MAQQLTQQQLQGMSPYLRNLYNRDPNTFQQRFSHMVPKASAPAPAPAMPQMPYAQPAVMPPQMLQAPGQPENDVMPLMPSTMPQAPGQPQLDVLPLPGQQPSGPANLMAPQTPPGVQNVLFGQQMTNVPQPMPGLDQGPAQFGIATQRPNIQTAVPNMNKQAAPAANIQQPGPMTQPAVTPNVTAATAALTAPAPAAPPALSAAEYNAQRSQQLKQQRQQEQQAAQQRYQQQQQAYQQQIQQRQQQMQEAQKKAQKTALISGITGQVGSALGRNLGSQYGQNLGLSSGLGGALGGALGGLAGQALGGRKLSSQAALGSIGGSLLGYGINQLFNPPRQQQSSSSGWGSLLGGLFG